MSSAMTVTMSSAHSPTFPSLHLRHNSFSNPYVAIPMSQLILQPFRCFSFSNLSVTSPTSRFILQPFRRFTCHSSLYNPTAASPTSQFIIQPFFRFSYGTSSSLNSPGEPPMKRRPDLIWECVEGHAWTPVDSLRKRRTFGHSAYIRDTRTEFC